MKEEMSWTLLGIAILLSLHLFVAGEAAAMAGECLQRNSASDAWSANRMTFEQCRDLNQARDGDNVFDAQGLVWWKTS
jgi:hypothetical protein